MNLGVVGHAAEKFTPETEAWAKAIIRAACDHFAPDNIVSGRCPMGGVDIYAEEIAEERAIPTIIHKPVVHTWSHPKGGFKERNLKIAEDSDVVLVVVVRELPPGYGGMKFSGCYHCRDRKPPHVKSGGCWTAWKAKRGVWRIIG